MTTKKEIDDLMLEKSRAEAHKEKLENIKCDHVCSGNCRREGCNCDCGEWHLTGEEEGYCKTCNSIIGDGHECDNCSFCGSEPADMTGATEGDR